MRSGTDDREPARHGFGVQRLLQELRDDLDDLRTGGTMPRAAALADASGEELAADVLPMYFTGRSRRSSS